MEKVDKRRFLLLINNKEVETDQYVEIRDPGRLTDIVAEVAQGTVEHVDQAVHWAHQAFSYWSRMTLDQRCDLLLQAAAVLEKEGPSLVPLICRETGMLPQVMKIEIDMAAQVIRNIVEEAQGFFVSKQVEDEQSLVVVEKRPIGVIAGLASWNVPILLTIQKMAPALVSGNTIVFKTSPYAPCGISILLQKIAALFPDGVLQTIHGDHTIGSALTTHPLVRKITFTGGNQTAKQIMKSAADSLKSLHFELGGNDPAIVLDDVNLDKSIPNLVAGIFRRSGQFCVAIKRVYVPEKRYAAFVEQLCDEVDKFKIGHQLNEQVTLGPLNNKAQYQYVNDLITRTKQTGAKTIQLGKKLEPDAWGSGYYIQPTIVTDVNPFDEIVVKEQFGPVIPIIPYKSEKDAIDMANQSIYGLGSTIWSENFERAMDMARQVEAGMTFINRNGPSLLGHKHIPFGGVKESGFGRENTDVGLSEYVNYHAINFHK